MGTHQQRCRGRAWIIAGAVALAMLAAQPSGVADEAFTPGTASARALVVRAGPSQAGLAVAVNLAESMAGYQNTVARGVSTAFGSGVLGLLVPDLVAQLPQPTRIDSTEEGSEDGRKESFPPAPAELPVGFGATSQEVSAAGDPRGAATTTLGDLALPGVLTVGGASSTATAGVVDGTTREARATVDIPVVELAGGMIRLEGLRWRAVQTSGAAFPDDVEDDAGFSIGRIVLAGQEVAAPDTPAEITDAFAQLNAALAPTGVVLRVPTAGRVGAAITMSPLVVGIADSQVGATVLGPVLGAAQPVRDAAVAPLLAQVPEAAVAVLVADVALGSLTGAGGVTVEIGGAQAQTDGTSYASPFGAGAGGGAAPRPLAIEAGSASLGGTSSAPHVPAPAPAAARPPSAPAPASVAAGPTSAPASGGGQAISRVPVAHDSDAGPIGSILAAGLVGTLALAGAEWSRARRGRFSFGEEG
jgi:hypothetical protein